MYVSERVVGQWLANVLPMSNGARWHRRGQWLANGWSMAGKWLACLANGWPMAGQWLANVWPMSNGARWYKTDFWGARKWWHQTDAAVSFLPPRECVRKRFVFFFARVPGARSPMSGRKRLVRGCRRKRLGRGWCPQLAEENAAPR